MVIILKQELYQIKAGFAARSSELGLVAHGSSPELARRNLERTALLFLRPFERQGRLKEELQILGVRTEDDGQELIIVSRE